MRNTKSYEHVILLMTSYELLQKHLMAKEIECERRLQMCERKKTKYISFVAPKIQTWKVKVIVKRWNKHRITLRGYENQKIVQKTEGCRQQKVLHRR